MVLSSLILYVVLQQTLTTDADAFLRGKAVDLTASIQVIGGPTAYWVHLPDLDRFVESDVYVQVLNQTGEILDESVSMGGYTMPMDPLGVAAGMTQTDGAIGYLSFDFAVTSNLGVAAIKRDDGTYIAPSVDSISKAGAILKFPISPDTNILNSSANGAYPIASTTYLLLYKDQTDKAKGQQLIDFVYWALTKGQDEVTKLNYSPLPSSIQQEALKQLDQITSGGSPLKPSSAVTG